MVSNIGYASQPVIVFGESVWFWSAQAVRLCLLEAACYSRRTDADWYPKSISQEYCKDAYLSCHGLVTYAILALGARCSTMLDSAGDVICYRKDVTASRLLSCTRTMSMSFKPPCFAYSKISVSWTNVIHGSHNRNAVISPHWNL